MFLLPVVITFIVLLIALIVICTDPRVYSMGLRLDLLEPFATISILAAGMISFILYIGGLR